jgi:hypothetical protein
LIDILEAHPLPAGRNHKRLAFLGHGLESLLLLEFLRFDQCGAFCLNLFKEFCGGAIFWPLVGEFAADGCLKDRAFDCFGELAV